MAGLTISLNARVCELSVNRGRMFVMNVKPAATNIKVSFLPV